MNIQTAEFPTSQCEIIYQRRCSDNRRPIALSTIRMITKSLLQTIQTQNEATTHRLESDKGEKRVARINSLAHFRPEKLGQAQEPRSRTTGDFRERERGPFRAAVAKRRGVTQLLGPCQVTLPPRGPRDLLPNAPLEPSRVVLYIACGIVWSWSFFIDDWSLVWCLCVV